MYKVSIIIPLHNNVDFIDLTIKSCLSQSYKNIEIIVVENGSTDGSLEKVQAITDPRIQIFDIGKASPTIARNFGLSKSSGDYIQFLDADDLLSSNKISNQIRILKKAGSELLVSCGWAKFSGEISSAKLNPQTIWKDYGDPIKWLIDSWSGGGMMQTACWLTHRKIVERAGLWNEDLKQNPNDDGEFFCRVILKSNGILFDSEGIVYYREPNKNNVSENRSDEAVSSLLESFCSYEDEILKVEKSDRVKRALAYNYRRFIYEFYPRYPHLLKKAQIQLKNLDIKNLPIVGGMYFQSLSKIIGFNMALRLRTISTKFIN